MKKITSVDDYITGLPESTQKILIQLRSIIRKILPTAEETISYGIPTYKLDGRYVIYFAGHTKHTSVYPAPRTNEAFRKELSKYPGGKGTIQFPLDKPLPVDLIRKIVRFRQRETIRLMRKLKTQAKP
jgi:uncharacterized protein YdhG (YjbR/CyaY superfamily)